MIKFGMPERTRLNFFPLVPSMRQTHGIESDFISAVGTEVCAVSFSNIGILLQHASNRIVQIVHVYLQVRAHGAADCSLQCLASLR